MSKLFDTPRYYLWIVLRWREKRKRRKAAIASPQPRAISYEILTPNIESVNVPIPSGAKSI